jgi:hypothetical protein
VTSAPAPKLERKPPVLFTASAVLVSSGYGLVLMVPVIVSMLYVTVIQFSALTVLIPLATIAAATFFLPIGFGNPYISRLVRHLHPAPNGEEPAYIVQLTRSPRIRSGLLALLEDADDIGFLSYTESGMEFVGDSVQLSIPYESIRNLRQQNVGARALFAYGLQTVVSLEGFPEGGTFKFSERSSWILTTSRRNGRQVYQRLRVKVDAVAAGAKAV